MVGAGAGAFGAPTDGAGAVGATDGAGGAPIPVGIGGLVAATTGAPGAAGGASDALRVTRTVSFFSGMEEVCFEAGIEEVPRGAGIDEVAFGGGISFSLISGAFFRIARLKETTSRSRTCQTSISRLAREFSARFRDVIAT
jgi:hypothetical protein